MYMFYTRDMAPRNHALPNSPNRYGISFVLMSVLQTLETTQAMDIALVTS